MNKKIFDIVRKFVLEAGGILKRLKLKNFKTMFKDESDLVTEVDYFVEDFLVKSLKKEFPCSNFLTEETYKDAINNKKEFLWIIDPLDGTTNYFKKFMFYSISLALYTDNKVVMGIVYAPELNSLYWSLMGSRSFKNNIPIKVSIEQNIKNSFLVTGFSHAVTKRKEEPFEIFKKISLSTLATRRCGSAAIDLAMVSEGIFDGFWEEGLNPWDVAAGYILVKNAGGKITDYSNKKFSLFSNTIVATNQKIHQDLLKIIKCCSK